MPPVDPPFHTHFLPFLFVRHCHNDSSPIITTTTTTAMSSKVQQRSGVSYVKKSEQEGRGKCGWKSGARWGVFTLSRARWLCARPRSTCVGRAACCVFFFNWFSLASEGDEERSARTSTGEGVSEGTRRKHRMRRGQKNPEEYE